MIKVFFFFHLTYNDHWITPNIPLNITIKSIAHVASFSIHLHILLNAYMLHEFKPNPNLSMTMRNSLVAILHILGYELTHKCNKAIFTQFICIYLFSKSICSKESNDTNIHKTGQDNWVQVETSCGQLNTVILFQSFHISLSRKCFIKKRLFYF